MADSVASSAQARIRFDDGQVLSQRNERALEARQFYGRTEGQTLQRSITTVEEMNHKARAGSVGPGGHDSVKLGTFDGVFLPTTLNVLSILMFLRFGFILGQTGILGMLLLLLIAYSIDLLTTLSISAISTNGTVRGGGAYYMISRSLGPEFGGSIGVVFYIGQVLNTGLNAVGFCEPLMTNFGGKSGVLSKFFPEGYWWTFLYSSVVLACCVALSSVGSKFFARSTRVLFVILIFATVSVPVSVAFVKPYVDPRFGAAYTGFSFGTIRQNLLPHFTKGAAGSQIKGRETFQDIFGIFFPATVGIFAGASMSGDLRKPSKSIPTGTLWGLLTTFILYASVILAIGSSVSRELLYSDVDVIGNVNLSPYIVIFGEFSTSLFSTLVGVIGAAKLLQAVARDQILPGIELFASGQGAEDTPYAAIAFTWVLTQLTLLLDINRIAGFITMAYLMTFVVTNLACFLLKIASAPNFRPSFRYFNSYTAGVGTIACVLAMIVADKNSASIMIMFLASLFAIIHYVSPPKPWGDVSQSLIYHQVRKYLLRLRQDHVKFWRPQILLLVDSPRTSWSLIQFCNHLKKGGLYILGHVMITQDFRESYAEMKKQQSAWNKLREMGNIKGFVQVAAGPDVVWGARNVYMGSGLGGMKPNITVLGIFGLEKRMGIGREPGIDVEPLPTDTCRKEPSVTVSQWVNIIEDLLLMQANVAVAKGFNQLEFPADSSAGAVPHALSEKQGYIDLYPIQMSAQIVDERGEMSALTTNFDTYMLILQLGAILHTVPAWKHNHTLRVVAFVEFEEDVRKERERIALLLEKLRIKAEILVMCLSSGQFGAYNVIIQGAKDTNGRISEMFAGDEWWQELQHAREEFSVPPEEILENIRSSAVADTPAAKTLQRVIAGRKRRHTMVDLQRLGVSYSMQTSKLRFRPAHFQSREASSESESDSTDDDGTSSDSDSDSPGTQGRAGSSHHLSEPEEVSRRLFVRRGSLSVSPNSRSPASSAKTTPQREQLTVPGQSPRQPAAQSPGASPKVPSGSSTVRRRIPLAKNYSSSNVKEDIERAKRLKPHFSGEALIHDSEIYEGLESGIPTTEIRSPLKKPASGPPITESTPLLSGDSNGKGPSSGQTFDNAADSGSSRPPLPPPRRSSSADDANYLSFNDLPAKAQHVILNDLMKSVSKDSVVLFSTLPAPAMGTYKSEQESREYVDLLHLWLDGLPPTILLHSQVMTVTTAL